MRDWTNYLLPLLMLLTIAATVGALTWSCTNDLIVGNPDAKTHLIIARRVVDNITPGAGQLGRRQSTGFMGWRTLVRCVSEGSTVQTVRESAGE